MVTLFGDGLLHILVCLGEGCGHVLQALGEVFHGDWLRHGGEIGTRAI